jgi:DedD protein
MPLETKKVLWTLMSVVIILVVASGIALALAFPRGSSAGAPASIAAVAPPRSASPDEYVRTFDPAPVPPAPAATSTAPGSDIIIVYGEKPDAATIPVTPDKPYVPATSMAQPAAIAPKPAATSPAPETSTAKSPVTVKPATKPAAKAPAVPKTIAEYWIQAAAFTSRTRADDLQREMATKNLSTLITVKDLDGVTWYRVRIGPYTTEREAKGWLEKIRVVPGCTEAYVSKQSVTR